MRTTISESTSNDTDTHRLASIAFWFIRDLVVSPASHNSQSLMALTPARRFRGKQPPPPVPAQASMLGPLVLGDEAPEDSTKRMVYLVTLPHPKQTAHLSQHWQMFGIASRSEQ